MLRTTLSVLAAAALLAAVGCGSDDDNGGSGQAAAPAAATTTAAAETTEADDTTTAGDDDGTADQGSGDAASDDDSGSGSGSTLKLSADPGGGLKFDRTELTAKAGRVTITMDNPASAGIPHAVAIEGGGVDEDGQTAEPGGTSTVSADLEPGTYTFYCPVGQHEQAGMKGTLRIR